MTVLSNTLFNDIIVAMLAVNNYPLSKAEALKEKLAREVTVAKAARCKHEEVVEMLVSVGYDRGPVLTSLVASRVQELGFFAEKNGFEKLEHYLAKRDREGIEKFLLALYGVGPKVVQNFLVLQDLV